jgi:hypothetical protein
MMAHFMPPGRVHDSPSLVASRGTVDAEETTLVARNKKSARMTEFSYGGDGVFLSNILVQKSFAGILARVVEHQSCGIFFNSFNQVFSASLSVMFGFFGSGMYHGWFSKNAFSC